MNNLYILIGTPCYGGNIKEAYFNSILKLKDLCFKLNINLDIVTIGSESLITRARNFYVSKILNEKKYSHLFFIDSDIKFDPESVVKLLLANKDVICGIYPKKTIDWNKIINKAKSDEKQIKLIDLLHNCADYCLNLDPHMKTLQIENNLIKIKYGGTGFMLIKREVIEAMISSYPETKYNNDVYGYGDGDNFYALFDTKIDKKSGRYLSEDFTFCDRCIEMGIDIYADVTIELTHIGSYDYPGNYIKSLDLQF